MDSQAQTPLPPSEGRGRRVAKSARVRVEGVAQLVIKLQLSIDCFFCKAHEKTIGPFSSYTLSAMGHLFHEKAEKMVLEMEWVSSRLLLIMCR